MPEFLLEIGTEEVPAGYIGPALEQMKSLFAEALKAESLEFGEVRATGTPRRLVLWADGIPDRQPDRSEEVSGPPAKVAFDADGKPTKAAQGFAKGQGVSVDQIEVRDTKKGPYCFAVKKIKGKATIEILQAILPDLIGRIGFPKSMVWTPRSKEKKGTFTFARPIRSIAALFGNEVIQINVNGVESGRSVMGHPFLAPGAIELASADFQAYKKALRERKVVVDYDERKQMIRQQIERILSAHGSSLQHEDLLDEVTNLVEYPTAMEGSFDEQFLGIPDAVIEAAMMGHQRYFPVRNSEGKLEAKFIFIANRGGEAEQLIRQGNERVLRARLADARFFWDEDRKTKLEDRLEALKGVQFLGELEDRSSYHDKALRLEHLARYIAKQLAAEEDNMNEVGAAARLCKCDLVTSMVKEFPALQGIMGGEYAREEGMSEEIWKGIRDQYRPRSAGDRWPEVFTGYILSLADKLDSLAACFSVGKRPSGSQDPFALRRQALAVLSVVGSDKLETLVTQMLGAVPFSLSLRDMAKQAVRNLGATRGDVEEAILAFFADRLYQLSVDRGDRHDIVSAVIGTGFDDIPDFFKRLGVIAEESKRAHWADLVFLVQRAANVAKIGEAAGQVDESLFEQDEERALWGCFMENRNKIESMIVRKDYEAASAAYCAAFSKAIHEFFDKVFVNVDNEKVKKNRIRMVKEINELYSRHIADLSQIVISGDGEKK